MERLDVTGEICPRPALLVRETLKELEPGEELLVTGDYPPAERNLRRSCSFHGFAVEAVETPDDTTFQLKIVVTEEASLPEA